MKKEKEEMAAFTLRIPEKLRASLESKAVKKGLSLSSFIRMKLTEIDGEEVSCVSMKELMVQR